MLQLEWQYSQEDIDWKELSDLYKIAPLGDKQPEDLEQAFSNSMFKCFVFESGDLVGVGRALADGIDCLYIYVMLQYFPIIKVLALGKALWKSS